MDLFRFLKRQIRASVPPPQPIQPAGVAHNVSDPAGNQPLPPSPPTPHEIRRLLFDAVASGDESRLHDLCNEHHDLIVQHSEAWLELPSEFRASPQLQEWYANGLRAIRDYCAQRASENKLTVGIREILDAGPIRPTVFRDQER